MAPFSNIEDSATQTDDFTSQLVSYSENPSLGICLHVWRRRWSSAQTSEEKY